MEDCGEAKICLGQEICRDRENRTPKVSQVKYVNEILCRFRMNDAKTISTPMESQVDQSTVIGSRIDETRYRKAVGSV